MTINELRQFRFLIPWQAEEVSRGVPGLEQELQREVGAGHVLYHVAGDCRAIAHHGGADDVLFGVIDDTDCIILFAEVHLTWSRGRESFPQFPITKIYEHFEDWVELSMMPTHNEFKAQ
jgi:hypothetical protein